MISKEILAPGIVLYKTDLSVVQSILNKVEPAINGRWNVAKGVNTSTYNDEFNEARRCFDYPIDKNVSMLDNQLRDLFNETDNWIQPCIDEYVSSYSIEKVESGPYIYLKYGKSDKFDHHIDDGKKYPRTVSVSAYLNDDYDGGMLEFTHFNISHKPSAGDIVVFSSSFPYMHRVTPTLSGTRYAIVNWYRYQGYPLVMD